MSRSASSAIQNADLPLLLSDKKVQAQNYLPDFSYAGYANGERQPDTSAFQVINVIDHGIFADDELDDSQALIALLAELKTQNTPVVLQFNSGRYIISSIIFIERSNIVLRGAGSGDSGTEFYFPRPLIYTQPTEELAELREYLVKLNKVQKEKANNILLPYTEWSWSGGFFWTKVPAQRVKSYLEEYDQTIEALSKATQGKQGAFELQVKDSSQLKRGQIVEIQWHNIHGKDGPLLKELYHDKVTNIGSHHWQFTNLALARQQVEITAINGNKINIKTPLLHNISTDGSVSLVPWQHLKDVGFEHMRFNFAFASYIAHHVEQGANGIYLTRVYNSWIDDVQITNADSGILTEEIANVSIKNVLTNGEKLAHYSVQIGGVHNVLVEGLKVLNPVVHSLSFNTFSSRNVYLNCEIAQHPSLDQHSGVNQQNLFDNIRVFATLKDGASSYPLFAGGGAKYWKPSHGAYNTLWNIQITFSNGHERQQPVLLNGMTDGPLARLVGITANLPIDIEYGPAAYIEGLNTTFPKVPSLYHYQLNKRLQH
ncbi:hypothetical protein AX660_04665 [Paraglaciecola hydrolytica]|uniref:Uncharacterized protein n=2 Tax=Paraglaciecola hydrolytica TaxID=1799789 RepID=A0A136A670_9ALTE|nr:hypothetical protein AX660_04665 [Paraglaciecola hydrolytica]